MERGKDHGDNGGGDKETGGGVEGQIDGTGGIFIRFRKSGQTYRRLPRISAAAGRYGDSVAVLRRIDSV